MSEVAEETPPVGDVHVEKAIHELLVGNPSGFEIKHISAYLCCWKARSLTSNELYPLLEKMRREGKIVVQTHDIHDIELDEDRQIWSVPRASWAERIRSLFRLSSAQTN